MTKKQPKKPKQPKNQPYSFDELVNCYRHYAQFKGWSTREEDIHEQVNAWMKSRLGDVGLAIDFQQTTEDNAPHLPFLQAIIELPDDDAPRLVFADWLDEHGEPERAELIRLQCALNSLPSESSERASLQERVQLLLQAHLDNFLTPLTRLGLRFGEETQEGSMNEQGKGFAPSSTRYHLKAIFRRGFVEEITLRGSENLRTFARHAEACFRLTPLRHLEVTNVHGLIEGMDQGWFPVGVMFPEIDFGNDEDLRALVQRPEMARLRTLLLRLHIGIQEARALADSPFFNAQTTLLLYPGANSLYSVGPETELTIDDIRRQALAQEREYGSGHVPEGPPEEIASILRARFGESVRWRS